MNSYEHVNVTNKYLRNTSIYKWYCTFLNMVSLSTV